MSQLVLALLLSVSMSIKAIKRTNMRTKVKSDVNELLVLSQFDPSVRERLGPAVDPTVDLVARHPQCVETNFLRLADG